MKKFTDNDINGLYKIINQILKNDFKNSYINGLKMGDIDQWDSLSNMNILLAIESKYKIRFTINEMSNINSFKKILEYFNK